MKETLNSILSAPPLITICGRDSIKIENVLGIAGFTSDGVSVRVAGGIVLTEGDSIEISQMRDGMVIILGKIKTVSFV